LRVSDANLREDQHDRAGRQTAASLRDGKWDLVGQLFADIADPLALAAGSRAAAAIPTDVAP
jgi:hypothetical protein